ncbi:hypothetical protein pdam_00003073, partial [Pocillopora damicornis]
MQRLLVFVSLTALDLVYGKGRVDDGCVTLTDGDKSFNGEIEYVPMKWFETPSVVSLSPACTGETALGLESGLVTFQQMTASSTFKKNHGPSNGRLNHAAADGKTGAWSAGANDTNQWLQVDFGRNARITKLATQGRQDYDQWVKTFTLSYTLDGNPSFQIYQENGAEKVFNANKDRDTIVNHVLIQPIIARSVQINPKSWNGHISMRAEFYGCILSDRYQVLGRVVHMDFVKEQLKTKKKVNFGDSQEQTNGIELAVMADTIYVKGDIKMRGTKKLTMFSRKLSFLKGSKLDLRAPDLLQTFDKLEPGADGKDGNHGVNGTIVEISAHTVLGYINIITNGGNGNKGQNGADGRKGADSMAKELDKTQSDCNAHTKRNDKGKVTGCTENIKGTPGAKGGNGGDGGYSGKSGNGGNAGRQTIYITRLLGNIELKTCRGTGGQAAKNGVGGEAPVSAGSTGQVADTFLQKLNLDRSQKDKYPVVLMKVMTRYAEDLVWLNNTRNAQAVFEFIADLATGRDDDLEKFAKRRLGFLNKKGFDRFGNNKLFAPLMKWETFKEQLVRIKDNAQSYENAYNEIRASIERQEGIKQVLQALPLPAKIQVHKEKERLVEARRIALSEKRAYVQ